MTLADLLASEVASLPKPPRGGPFRRALRDALNAYRAAVDRLDPADDPSARVLDARDDLARAADAVVAALDASLYGQAGRARDALVEAVEVLHPHLTALLPMPRPHVVMLEGYEAPPREVLFRMRAVDAYEDVDRAGIFHVPFDRRHQVGTQRYSVLGVPMLYLGTSLYACWLELGRPPLDRVWMSAFRFRTAEPPPLLNFGLRPQLVGTLLRDQDSGWVAPHATAYAVAWPLIAACAFRAKKRGSPFVEEYVVPQLLMSWVAERGQYAGVRYFSTHVRPLGTNVAGMNVVLPARNAGDEGHCGELAGLVELTAPVSWAHTEAVGDRTPAYTNPSAATLQNGEGAVVPYYMSVFAQMEARLTTYPFAPLG